MNNRIATIASFIFNPMFVPLYGIIMLLNLNYFFYYSFAQKLYIVGVIAMFTCIIPGLFLFLLYKARFIDSIEVKEKNQRHLIYIVTAISYIICFYICIKIQLPRWVLLMAVCIFITILLMGLINIGWKISIHAAAAGCFTGATFFTSYLLQLNPVGVFILVIMFSGLTISSRLQLKAHTLMQVFCGYVLGIFFLYYFPLILGDFYLSVLPFRF